MLEVCSQLQLFLYSKEKKKRLHYEHPFNGMCLVFFFSQRSYSVYFSKDSVLEKYFD